MNWIMIRGYFCAIFLMAALTCAIIFSYETGMSSIRGIIHRDDYILYDPKSIPLLLVIPAGIFVEFCLLLVFLPFKEKTFAFMGKFKIAMIAYAWCALIIGILLSIIISFYPLGTDYYKCDSTSVVSSGSHYAKSKEMCKAKAWKPSDD